MLQAPVRGLIDDDVGRERCAQQREPLRRHLNHTRDAGNELREDVGRKRLVYPVGVVLPSKHTEGHNQTDCRLFGASDGTGAGAAGGGRGGT